MMFKKFNIFGAICLLIFIIFGMLSITRSIPKSVLFLLLGITIESASFFLMSISMPKDKNGESWLYLIPFTVLLIFTRLIFGWDLLIPFYITGIFSIAFSYIFKHGKTKDENIDFIAVLRVILSGCACVFLFICITGFVGVFI